MNTTVSAATAALEERFGRQVAARLSEGNRELPHDIGERLRAARVQALAKRKPVREMRAAPAVVPLGRSGTVGLGGGWWTRVGALVPLVALVGGLIVIHRVQDDRFVNELAEVDAALLTDALPPTAYTDPGFAQFLKSEAAAER